VVDCSRRTKEWRSRSIAATVLSLLAAARTSLIYHIYLIYHINLTNPINHINHINHSYHINHLSITSMAERKAVNKYAHTTTQHHHQRRLTSLLSYTITDTTRLSGSPNMYAPPQRVCL